AERADRCHRIDPGDAAELPLEGSRHGGRHGGRRRAGQAGADAERGIVDTGQVGHRQGAVRDYAEQRDSEHQQAGRDGPPDEYFRKVHWTFQAWISDFGFRISGVSVNVASAGDGLNSPEIRNLTSEILFVMPDIYVYTTGVR